MSINNSAAVALLRLQSDIFLGHVLITALVGALVAVLFSVVGVLALPQAATMKTIGIA